MCYAFYWSLSSCVSCKKENNPKLALGISVPVYIPFSDSYSSVSWKRKYWGKLKNMSMQKARQQKVVRLCGEIMNCSISVVSLLIKFLISENLKTTKIKLKSKCWQQGCYSMDFFSYCGQKKYRIVAVWLFTEAVPDLTNQRLCSWMSMSDSSELKLIEQWSKMRLTLQTNLWRWQ